MSANTTYVVRNTNSLKCQRCEGVHEFLTLLSDDAACDAPAGFSREVAESMARLKARGTDDVERAPDDTILVMHPSARRLPVRGEPQLAQFSLMERRQ